MSEEKLKVLETQVKDMGYKVYSEEVKAAIDSILSECPEPSKMPPGATAKQKVRALLIRAKARLLLPAFSKEAEDDLNKALKLSSTDPSIWTALSECYWKRNALTEAKDALHSALQVDAKYQPAMCQLSRILRSKCNMPDVSPEDKLVLLDESIQMAKNAVAVDFNDGEAWTVLGVALLQQAIASGLEMAILKKSLSALHQAVAKNPKDPDTFYNRGVVHKSFGHYGSAFQDFMQAFELDPKGLKGARSIASDILDMLVAAGKKMKQPHAGMTDKEYKKLVVSGLPDRGQSKTPGGGGGGGKQKKDESSSGASAGMEIAMLEDVMDKDLSKVSKSSADAVLWVGLVSIDIISKPTDQPLAFLCTDKQNNFCVVLLYRVLPGAIKDHSTVFLPFPPSSAGVLGHKIPSVGGMEGSGATFSVPTIVVEPSTVIVNGEPIPQKYYQQPKISTRQFQ